MKSETSVWDCKVCIAQMFGGPRCEVHNPIPEERERRAAATNEREVVAF